MIRQKLDRLAARIALTLIAFFAGLLELSCTMQATTRSVMTRPLHRFAISSERSSSDPRKGKRVHSNVHVPDFAERLF
jgi:hypothetical protein